MPELQYIDSKALPESLIQPLRDAPLPGLGGGPHDASLAAAVEAFEAAGGRGDRGDAPERERVMLAALWLVAGDLDRSHRISQDIPSRDGSFWHGVMHRREGDFGNAGYWFRRAADHPAYARIARAVAADPLAAPLAESGWDPLAFVDQCQRAVRRGGDLEQQCVQAQWIEWQVALAERLERED